MSTGYETSRTVSFEIPNSIPLTIESREGIDVITWPTVASPWETLRELKKLSGTGADQVTQLSREGEKFKPVKLGSIKQLEKVDIDKLVSTEIFDDTTGCKLVWERFLDADNIFFAGISRWNLTFKEQRLRNVFEKTGSIALKAVIEPLVEAVINELSPVVK